MFTTPFAFMAGYDPDAQAFFNRVETAGGSLTPTEKNATNQLVLDLKSYSLWSSMKAIYPMVGASDAACKQNLKSSSFTGTFYGGITFSSTGILGNRTDGYMDTGFNAYNNLDPTNAHLSYYSRTADNQYITVEIGYYNNGNQIFHLRAASSFQFIQSLSSVLAYTETSNAQGFWLNAQRSYSDREIYLNGSSQDTDTTLDNSEPWWNGNFYLLARNENGSPAFFSNKECSFASIGDGLTDTQVANLYTSVQAFQTTLGRQV